jgi:hypothetical protein
VGKPNQPLLDIPVTQDRAGLIVVGGLSPISAVEESGVPTYNLAMSTLFEFRDLISYTDLIQSFS